MNRARRHRSRRAIAVVAVAGLFGGALLSTPAAAAPVAAAAPAVAPALVAAPAAAAVPDSVTLAGSLQSELGCPGDWDPTCAATDLPLVDGTRYAATVELPAGSHEFKIAIDHSWDENYGAGGVEDGSNIPLVLQAPAAVTIGYDHATHLVTMASADLSDDTVTAADRELAGTSLRDELTREQFYFLMTDRFANADPSNDDGGYDVPDGTGEPRLVTGLDPTAKGFYHGGDIAGIRQKLDYIKGLGTTSIWLTPSFKNNPVQGEGADVSAGYHGYWITDFTQIDPHLGTNEDLKGLIDDAHRKGMKVFFDIITNHTADVIDYEQGQYTYIDKATTPYVDADGTVFDDHDYAAGDTFPTLDTDSFPYTPVVDPAVADVKVPAWLNDPLNYHNRGNAAFDGTEGDVYGDFSGLDDLFTEKPSVRDGLIDIYAFWAKFGIDGFRIDTVKHVNLEFWQKFAPAMEEAAASVGTDDFFQFGEVYDADPAKMSVFTTAGKLPATLDFGFQARATGFGLGQPTRDLAALYANDDYYTDTDSNAYAQPTFLGNHDMGRIGYFLQSAGHTGTDLLKRDLLTQQLMFLTRGQPVTYYGDEQGFVGDGGDQDARQDMFPSKVASYNDDTLIGTDATTAQANFDAKHPLYTGIKALAKLRKDNPALADGAQIPRYSSNDAGVFAVSRIDATQQREYVVASNNATTARKVSLDTFSPNIRFSGLYGGAGRATAGRDGSLTVTVPPLSTLVWKADARMPASPAAPQAVFVTPDLSGTSTVGGRAPIRAAVPAGGFNQVTYAWRPAGGTDWTALGTDDNAPYQVFHDVSGMAEGSLLEYRVLVRDNVGHVSATSTSAVVGDPAPASSGGGTAQSDPPETQPTSVTVAGDLDSEIGCPGDWQPDCAAAHLTLDEASGIWSGTFDLPAGTDFAYKAALNDSWTENYGAGAVRDGGNITVTVPDSGEVTFFYDPGTHWATSDAEGPIVTAPGTAQSELGCAADWSADCLRPWLQDPDGDGTYTFSTARIPAGTYQTKVTHGLSFDENWGAGGEAGGADIAYTVPAGAVVTFSYVLATHVLTVSAASSTAADLSQSKGQWLDPARLAWDLPAAANQYHYRLHFAGAGGLGIDATSLTGGGSIELTRTGSSLPAALAARHPSLAGYDTLQLPSWVTSDRRLLERIITGQVALAAYDDSGALVDATGVQLPWLLDTLYAGAAQRTLGPVWKGGKPSVAVWAPTALSVELRLTPAGSTKTQRVQMFRDATGTWTANGAASWRNARYVFAVRVYVPSTDSVETNLVTDPYSVALTVNSTASVLADLADPALTPAGWSALKKPALPQPSDTSIYELHIRDFSISDTTVPAAQRGTYLAFTQTGSAGMKHLKALAGAGLNTLHLLPAFDIATIEEERSKQATPQCDLPALTRTDPAGEAQQRCTSAVAGTDGFNWGYDPWHYTAPEGSYATNPDGAARTKEFRQMVAGINSAGLRVVMDVVYNHTAASGQDAKSVLDRIVPGYYQRLSATGALETSTCCANTATEHAMMDKLTVDSIVTWAKQYKVDGFRFDLMGHMPKQSILDVRAALDRLTIAKDGVDGSKIYLYGEGWDFGEVAGDALFEQATQANMAGTGVGTFNDRLRDSVRGGGPFDENPGKQGFGTGLFTDPNSSGVNGTPEEQKAQLLLDQDRIKVGLVGNLADYPLVDRNGNAVQGKDIDYNGAPTGYTAEPSETINYVDAHDNETLFDVLAYKLPTDTPMDQRVRMNTLSLATVALGQGPMFWHAGTDLLRSKSLDRDSYDSGDWFNRIDWTGRSTTFGSGMPPQEANDAKWPFIRPLLENRALAPSAAAIGASGKATLDLLRLRYSTPLLRLGSAAAIEQKVTFLTSGPDQPAGVIALQVDDTVGTNVDPALKRIVVVFNASPQRQSLQLAGSTAGLRLSPVQAQGSDAVVKTSTVGRSGVSVPGRTVAVFVQP